MKKQLLLIASAWMLHIASMNAQITLDTTISYTLGIGYSFKLVNISNTETKWYFADTLSNSFSLYNMDFTPFLTGITVPESFALTTSNMQVLYITRTLFDCDSSNIEYAYYSPANSTKPFRVVRTDGTILFQVDSANAPYAYGTVLGGTDVIRPIVNTSDGAKLFLQSGSTLSPSKISVYSLCDSLRTDVFDLEGFDHSFVQVFPNPASHLLTFRINLPDNMNQYRLLIMDNVGRIVKQEEINRQVSEYLLDLSYLSNGSYQYLLLANAKTYQTGQFMLTK